MAGGRASRPAMSGAMALRHELGVPFEEATEDRPGLRVAIAHADAPEWVDDISALALEARPQAEIELVENLGAVVGTHTGPGAVGFFWFQD